MAHSHQVSLFSMIWKRTGLLQWNKYFIANLKWNEAHYSGPYYGLLHPRSKPCCGGGGGDHLPGPRGWKQARVLVREWQNFSAQSQTNIPQSKKVTNHITWVMLKVYTDVTSPILLPKDVQLVSESSSLLWPEDFGKWQGYASSSNSMIAVVYKGNSEDLVMPQSMQGFLGFVFICTK